MKMCFRCGNAKPLDEFYAHPQMADGHLNKCKPCARTDVRAARERRPDYYRLYDQKRYAEGRHGPRPARPRTGRQPVDPSHRAARVVTGNAIRDGRLTRQPCEVCGAMKVDAHHDGYSKPLEVRWLCRRHHHDHHKAERQKEQAA